MEIHLKKFNKTLQHICWLVESGVHNSIEVRKKLKGITGLDSEHIQGTINSLFCDFARLKYGFVQLIDDQEYVLQPIVDSRRFAHVLQERVDDRYGIKPKINQRVQFMLWDGDNAPKIEDWTGVIKERRHNRYFIEYILVRDHDQEWIKLNRGYLKKLIHYIA